MKQKMVFVAIAAFLFAVTSAKSEVTWTVADGIGTANGSGEQEIGTVQYLTRLEANATDGVLKLSGEGIPFTGDAPVVSVIGTNVFDIPLTSSGSLSVVNGRDYQTYNSDGSYDDSDWFLLDTEYKTVFKNMNLADYVPVSGLAAGGAIRNGAKYTAFYIRRGTGAAGDYLTCQFQYNDSPYAKCLIVEFRQVGDSVKAKVLDSLYREANIPYDGVDLLSDYYGSDFEEGIANGTLGVATDSEASGYGIYSVTFQRQMDTAYLTMKREVTADSLAVGEDVVVVADPGDILERSDATMPAMTIDGALVITNTLDVDFSNALSGKGELYFGGCSDAGLSQVEKVIVDKQMSTTWQTVVYGGVLSSITNIYGTYGDVGMSATGMTGSTYNYKQINDALVVQCQVINHNTWIGCVYLEFRQMSTNIEARIKERWYCHHTEGLGVDFDGLAVKTTSGDPSANSKERKSNTYFEIDKLTLYFDTEESYDPSAMVYASLRGENTMTGGKIYQRGGIAHITSKNALSSNGGVYMVADGGRLILEASECDYNNSIGNGQTELRATGNSTITVLNNTHQLAYNRQKVYLDNSTLTIASSNSTTKDLLTYANFITLANGSHITGIYPTVGYATTSTLRWKVTGTSPSYLDTGLKTISSDVNSDYPLVFDVEDVTDDENADFIVNGPILPSTLNDIRNMTFSKTGSGTMRLNDGVRSNRPLYLDEGTIELGASDILCGTHPAVETGVTTPVVPVQFGGGALAGAAGTSNVVGYVTVTNNSQIVVGEGAVFTFPDCTAQAWTAGMTLSITGDVGKKSVRFGTSSAALTDAQQSALRINGKKAILNDDGYVRHAIGCALIIR